MGVAQPLLLVAVLGSFLLHWRLRWSFFRILGILTVPGVPFFRVRFHWSFLHGLVWGLLRTFVFGRFLLFSLGRRAVSRPP